MTKPPLTFTKSQIHALRLAYRMIDGDSATLVQPNARALKSCADKGLISSDSLGKPCRTALGIAMLAATNDVKVDIPKIRWYKIKKCFQGGSKEFQVRAPDNLSNSDWDCLSEWLGDNTDGGHAYGYTMYRDLLPDKDPGLPVQRYPAGICKATMEIGEKVVTTIESYWV